MLYHRWNLLEQNGSKMNKIEHIKHKKSPIHHRIQYKITAKSLIIFDIKMKQKYGTFKIYFKNNKTEKYGHKKELQSFLEKTIKD